MLNFSYYNPTEVVFGKGTVGCIGERIIANGITRVLVVTGGGSVHRSGLFNAITASLDAQGVAWEEFAGVRPNPPVDQVDAGIAAARTFAAEGFLALGGGSTIDACKGMAAGMFLESSAWTLFTAKQPINEAFPIFSVLTISGTGTEMNDRAVISNDDEGCKWSIRGHALFPKVTVIDPELQMTLPWRLTASGGIDAITHIMEFYTVASRSRRAGFFGEETSLSVGEGLMRAVVRSLDMLQDDPVHYDARASLAWASAMGLNGIPACGLGNGEWTAHGLEHGLSAIFPEITHGEGLAVLFPSWMETVSEQTPDIFLRYAKEVWGENSIEGGLRATREAFARWGAPTSLSHWGVTREDIPRIIESAKGAKALGQIAPLSDEEVFTIFERVL